MFYKQNFYQIVKVIIFLNCFGNFQNKEMIEKKFVKLEITLIGFHQKV